MAHIFGKNGPRRSCLRSREGRGDAFYSLYLFPLCLILGVSRRYVYISLAGACSLLGVERFDQAHRALGDCQAALAILRALVARHGQISLEAPPAHVPARVRGRTRWTTAESRQSVPVSAGGGDEFDPFLDSDDLP
jgi:hypothetical protein